MTFGMRKLIKRQFEEQLVDKWLGERVIHTTQTESYNSHGYLIGITPAESRIMGIISPVTEKDRDVMDLGVVALGDAHGFFKIDSGVNEKDYITSTRTGNKYQVVRVDDTARIHGHELFIHVYMKFREKIT